MDTVLPPGLIRKRKIKKLCWTGSVLIFVVILFMVLRAIIQPSLLRENIQTSIAEIGTIEATISASGVIIPEYEQVITTPIQTKIEKVFLNSGDLVQAGDRVLQLNTDQIQNRYDKYIDELELLKNDKNQLHQRLQNQQIDLQAQLDIKEMEVQFIASQLDREIHLHEIGGSSKENLEQAELNLEIARRELLQLTQKIENQKTILATDLKGLDLKISIQRNIIGETVRQIALAESRPGKSGIVTWINNNIGSTVGAGEIIARVADLGSFRVEAKISDIHADRLHVGGKARIRNNKIDLTGRISGIHPTVENGIITFLIELDDKSHQSLRSNLRVDIFVVTSSKDDALRVKNGSFYNGSVDQEVFIIKSDKAIRKIVNIGKTNYDYVEIQGDIHAGDEVIISDMQNFRHMEEVPISKD